MLQGLAGHKLEKTRCGDLIVKVLFVPIELCIRQPYPKGLVFDTVRNHFCYYGFLHIVVHQPHRSERLWNGCASKCNDRHLVQHRLDDWNAESFVLAKTKKHVGSKIKSTQLLLGCARHHGHDIFQSKLSNRGPYPVSIALQRRMWFAYEDQSAV